MTCARKAAEQRLRDQADQLTLANRYKSEFLANMSHELRTPLNSILILSDQLRLNSAGNLTEKQAKHADIVHRAGSDLLQLINDVLDLAKVESGRMQLKLEPLNMQDILVELDASLRPMAEIKGLRLHTQLEAGVPRVIHTDRIRLQQILLNLLSNALKFTEHGEVSLTVSCASGEPEEGYELLNFSVRDSGIGIPPSSMSRYFRPFSRLMVPPVGASVAPGWGWPLPVSWYWPWTVRSACKARLVKAPALPCTCRCEWWRRPIRGL